MIFLLFLNFERSNMDLSSQLFLLLILLFSVAFLYASVGHGGASGYLAVMTVLSIEASIMKSSSLLMNVAVSVISFIGFYKAGHFKLKLLIPFIITSVPMAYIGGKMTLPEPIYKKILAVCLLISVIRFVYQFNSKGEKENKPQNNFLAALIGAAIGFVSGMIGIGGGIFLSPILLLFRWANLKETAAISSAFIFLNSIASLAGLIQKGNISLPSQFQLGLIVAILGGILGSYYGSKKLNTNNLKYILAFGLIIASLKLLFL